MIGGTTLSGYNLFCPMQQGQPIDCRIAHRKCYKICKNEPFLPVSFCAMDFPPVLAMRDQWKFQAKQRKRSPCEPVNFCLSMCKLLDGSESLQTGLTSDVMAYLAGEALNWDSLCTSVAVKHFFSSFGFSMTIRTASF